MCLKETQIELSLFFYVELFSTMVIREFRTRNPFVIAEKLGCIVSNKSTVPSKGAFVSKTFAGSPIIVLDKDLKRVESKFVCAHEVFHLLSDSDYPFPGSRHIYNLFGEIVCLGDIFTLDVPGIRNTDEFFADSFAMFINFNRMQIYSYINDLVMQSSERCARIIEGYIPNITRDFNRISKYYPGSIQCGCTFDGVVTAMSQHKWQ